MGAGPPFPIGGPTSTSWREHALTRVGEERFLTRWVRARVAAPDAGTEAAFASIDEHLEAARQAAEGSLRNPLARAKSWMGGAMVERAMSNLDAAESELLRLAPEPYVRGQ